MFTFPYKLTVKISQCPAKDIIHECQFWFYKNLHFWELKFLIAWENNYHFVDWSDDEFIPF